MKRAWLLRLWGVTVARWRPVSGDVIQVPAVFAYSYRPQFARPSCMLGPDKIHEEES